MFRQLTRRTRVGSTMRDDVHMPTLRWLNLFSNGWVRHLAEFHESNPGMFEEELVLMLGCGVAGWV